MKNKMLKLLFTYIIDAILAKYGYRSKNILVINCDQPPSLV